MESETIFVLPRHLIIELKVKRVPFKYFPENRRLRQENHLISG